MGVTFKWRPRTVGKSFQHGLSSDVAILERVFGAPPWIFNESDLEKLDVIRETLGTSENVFADISKAVSQLGAIDVWTEY